MELVKENGGISVKRYTKRFTDGQAVMDCQSCPESWMGKSGERCTALYCRNRLKDRVAAYEDTGLDPEDILSATDTAKVACALHELNQYKDLGSIDRLRELLEADRDGRCVVFQPKASVVSHYYRESDLYIREVVGAISKEDYEAALREEEKK